MTLEAFRKNARIEECHCCHRETLVQSFFVEQTGRWNFYLCYVCAELPNRNNPEDLLVQKACAIASLLIDTLKPPKDLRPRRPRQPKVPAVAIQTMTRRRT